MCQCVLCGECMGSGSVWVSFSGDYLGSGRCDDLDTLETCETCEGSGITERCYECQEALDLELDEAEKDYLRWEAEETR
jgi:hypothetical protein